MVLVCGWTSRMANEMPRLDGRLQLSNIQFGDIKAHVRSRELFFENSATKSADHFLKLLIRLQGPIEQTFSAFQLHEHVRPFRPFPLVAPPSQA